LPLDNSFLYVEPIYIQSAQASMPQLRKVALAMGNKLAYADTYEQALAQLTAALSGIIPATPAKQEQTQQTAAPQQPSVTPDTETLRQIREHLKRYKDLSSQGKWADAGKELEEIQRLALK
jgi:hypothetical protein